MVAFPTDNAITVLSLFFDGTAVYILTNDGLFTYISGLLSKDTDLDIPNNASALIYTHSTYVVSTSNGIYTRRTYDPAWTQALSIQNAKINGNSQFIVVFGQDPLHTVDSLAYISTDGINWSNQTRLPNLTVVAAWVVSSSIYYATTTGLYFQDLSLLEAGAPVITLVDVLNDPDASSELSFNDVSADSTRIVAAVQDGTYWVNTSNAGFVQNDSGFGVLHKSQLINGSLWLFGRGLVSIEGVSGILRLSTGEALL